MSRSAVLWHVLRTMSFAVAVAAHPAAAQEALALCPTQLGARLEAIAAEQLGDRARWGALVQPLAEDSPTLYASNAQQYFTPASNAKLFTSAAALAHLGPKFRIATAVYTDAPEAPQGAVDLRLVGRGDPSFDSADLQLLAQQVSQAGITQVNQIIADERYLGDRFINPTWDWEDVQSGYGAPVNSLMLDQNAIGVR
ncbi:MAG: D-alanyl-D-alanine carboxypeptidase, partial [Elainellaceae cyanobacterium]